MADTRQDQSEAAGTARNEKGPAPHHSQGLVVVFGYRAVGKEEVSDYLDSASVQRLSLRRMSQFGIDAAIEAVQSAKHESLGE